MLCAALQACSRRRCLPEDGGAAVRHAEEGEDEESRRTKTEAGRERDRGGRRAERAAGTVADAARWRTTPIRGTMSKC